MKNFKSFSIYIDSFVIKIEFFFKFVELSYKVLTKFKFRILNNILSVAFRVASYKPPKPAFVVGNCARNGYPSMRTLLMVCLMNCEC